MMMTFVFLVGSFFWGWLSDFKGRRLVLLITIFFNGLFSFLFGFADTLKLAMAIRFLAGVANGEVLWAFYSHTKMLVSVI